MVLTQARAGAKVRVRAGVRLNPSKPHTHFSAHMLSTNEKPLPSFGVGLTRQTRLVGIRVTARWGETAEDTTHALFE